MEAPGLSAVSDTDEPDSELIDSPPHLSLARLLRARRQEMGLSVRALSNMTGVAASTVSRIEHGQFLPTLATAVRLAQVVGLDLSKLPGLGRGDELLRKVDLTERKLQPRSLREATSPATVRRQELAPGIKRNLRKIACSQPYRFLLVLKGRVKIRGRDQSWVLLSQGLKLDCDLLREGTFFAEAVEPTELLWIE